MTHNFARKLAIIANVAIIISALLLCVVIVKRYFFSSVSPGADEAKVQNEIRVGAKLPFNDIDWAKNNQTLLLAISKDCHFCTESAPFYKRLALGLTKRGNVKLIAVMPETVEEGQKYLSDHNVLVNEVRQIPLQSIGVRGTPTLIIADQTGTVTDVWLGKLTSVREAEVLSRLQIREDDEADDDSASISNNESQAETSAIAGKDAQRVPPDDANEIISLAELDQLMTNHRHVILLDVRNREPFAQEHIPQAKNIPVDELEARAINELSPSDLVVTYCRCPNSKLSKIAASILRDQGFRRAVVLQE